MPLFRERRGPIHDDGLIGAGIAVICGMHADAMLLEIGFIDSEGQTKIQQHIDQFAPLIDRAFCEFYCVAYPDDTTTLDPVATRRSFRRSALCTTLQHLSLG